MSEHDFVIWLKGYLDANGHYIPLIKEKLASIQTQEKPQSWFEPMGWYSDPRGTTIGSLSYDSIQDMKNDLYKKAGEIWFEPKPIPINEDIGQPWAVVTSTESFPLTEEST